MNDQRDSREPTEDEFMQTMRFLRRAMSVVTGLLVLAAALYYALR